MSIVESIEKVESVEVVEQAQPEIIERCKRSVFAQQTG